jgi:hypothetical protein
MSGANAILAAKQGAAGALLVGAQDRVMARLTDQAALLAVVRSALLVVDHTGR